MQHGQITISLPNRVLSTTKLSKISFFNHSASQSLSVSNQIKTHKLIIYARKKKSRSGFPPISKKTTWLLISFVASTFPIFPYPLNSVIRELAEIGNGNGGGSGFWKRGFGEGSFDGWGRKSVKLGYWCLLIGIVCVLYLGFGGEIECDLAIWVLGICLIGVSLKVHVKRFKDLILGFCCGLLVGLGLKREELEKWVKNPRSFSQLTTIVRRRRSAW